MLRTKNQKKRKHKNSLPLSGCSITGKNKLCRSIHLEYKPSSDWRGDNQNKRSPRLTKRWRLLLLKRQKAESLTFVTSYLSRTWYFYKRFLFFSWRKHQYLFLWVEKRPLFFKNSFFFGVSEFGASKRAIGIVCGSEFYAIPREIPPFPSCLNNANMTWILMLGFFVAQLLSLFRSNRQNPSRSYYLKTYLSYI